MRVVSLFSGVGGVEVGLSAHGTESILFCDIDPACRAVLHEHFPDVPIHDDIKSLESLPDCDIVTAGFPCQDLSLAGGKAGLAGERSGLVGEVLRLLRTKNKKKLRWLFIENVPYMLLLDRGSGMRSLVTALEEEGYSWAYRVVDARSFGLPQRRRRVLLVASAVEDPRTVLFADDTGVKHVEHRPSAVTIGPAYGFYWTMGKMGAGWAHEATPPIKGGSGLGIPSPPAIWLSDQDFVGTPQIEDAERLQGFAAGWTAAVSKDPTSRQSSRWRLVGNAVCPPMAAWVGSRLGSPGEFDRALTTDLEGKSWPKAAYGAKGERRAVQVSEWPSRKSPPPLAQFLAAELKPLSVRATAGFRARALQSKEIAWSPEFIRSLAVHISRGERTEFMQAAA